MLLHLASTGYGPLVPCLGLVTGDCTWWSAVMPDMLILSRSISTLARRSMFMIASPSLSRMWSSNTTSSGNRTRRLPGFSRANTLARRDIAQLTASH